MVNKQYSIAMTETLHYLKGINQKDLNKIPNKFMEFLKKNADNNYKCNFDYTKPLKDLELCDETRGIIAMICLNYWCETEDQKEAYINHLKENEKHYQQELIEKYNPDNIFKKSDKEPEIEQDFSQEKVAMIEYKESFFRKIINKIKCFLKL